MGTRAIALCVVAFACSPHARSNGGSRPDGPGTPQGDGGVDTILPDGPVTGVVQLAAGFQHTCALFVTGAVRCWGANDAGQIGYPGQVDVGRTNTPAQVGDVHVGGTVTKIAAGGDHTCAVLSTGALRCWGFGGNGALGYGNANNIGDDETPDSAGDVPVGAPVVDVAVGADQTCALAADGSVRCWGAGATGVLGYGNTTDLATPPTAPVPVGGSVLRLVAGGAYSASYTCAIVDPQLGATDGAMCWGSAYSGRLGYGNVDQVGDDETPASVGAIAIGGTPTAIAAGAGHTCAILDSHDVKCWGTGVYGRLGYGNANDVGDVAPPSSVGVVDVGGPVDQIALGGAHTCARLGAHVRCWGYAADGQLGYGNTTNVGDRGPPSAAGDVLVGGSVRSIAAGLLHTCAIMQTGAVRCWGSGGRGQLGYGNPYSVGDHNWPADIGDVPLM